ncbi:MAG TPA: GTPase ObgE [Kiritimatiellia bacterium]|nr:GTPase ObgE [Kiritimatiellia bacterium]HRZ12643.1 GTPase ObgE [Kiritimatiellia bacterium]HSA19589.1 GTPase ObgE [Kiritimatiellia bacterium]
MKAITFIDRARLYVYAGNGGNGCASFRREKYIPHGGPDGGDGGRGGSVILRADKNVDSLLDLYYEPHRRAEHAGPGRGKQCTGRDGRDLRVKVPPGTLVRHEADGALVGELLADGQELVVARGGRGGLGNMHFATSSHRAPRECTPGTPGEQFILRLELKSIADIGLVGYPNAGKSTLLRALTAARPKVAAYPFTTLHPVIGTLELGDAESLRIADIPGLIDGAHRGVGLGHDFLRHIERTKLLVFVVDMAGVDGRDPSDDWDSLQRELELYNAELARRPGLVVANKMDLPEAEERLKDFRKKTKTRPIPISALAGEGVARLREELVRRWETLAGA